MPRQRYNVNLDPEVVTRVKAQLGDTSFSRFTERALEAALGPRAERSAPSTEGSSDRAGTATPASPRAPVAPASEKEERQTFARVESRRCERCGVAIPSPSLRIHPNCGGKIVPEPV